MKYAPYQFSADSDYKQCKGDRLNSSIFCYTPRYIKCQYDENDMKIVTKCHVLV